VTGWEQYAVMSFMPSPPGGPAKSPNVVVMRKLIIIRYTGVGIEGIIS
jgi:hypothetical protein